MRGSRSRKGSLPLLVASISASMLVVLTVLMYSGPAPSTGAAIPPLANDPITTHHFTAAPSTTFVPAGTEWQVPVAAFQDFVVQLTLPGDLGGGFAASAAVTVYVLNTAAFMAFETNQSTAGSLWSLWDVTSGSLTLSMQAGTWYLVFVNPSPQDAVTIDVTSNIVATYPLGPGAWGT
jgi:hypothetical protein